MKSVIGLFLIVALVLCEVAAAPAVKTIWFKNGLWFDGSGFVSKDFYSVNGILTSRRQARIDEVVDLGSGYVLPPFGDGHSHELNDPATFVEQQKRFIQEGTGYLQVLTNGADNAARHRPFLNKPGTLDVLYANGGLTRTGQHPAFAYERGASGIKEWWLPENDKIIRASRKEENNSYWFFDQLADVERKWPLFLNSRPDVVKIYLLDVKNNASQGKSLSEEVAAALVGKAHSAGLRVAAHIETFDDLKIGIRIGVDFFAHMPFYNVVYSPTIPEQPEFTASELSRIKTRKIKLIPTLALHEDYSIIRDASNNFQGKFSVEQFERGLNFQKKTLATLKKAGFEFAIGSDRQSLSPELNYWVKNGVFTPLETLIAASTTTPQLMFPGRKIGMFKEGYEASFIVLPRNPLNDFQAIKEIRLRYKQGVPLDISN